MAIDLQFDGFNKVIMKSIFSFLFFSLFAVNTFSQANITSSATINQSFSFSPNASAPEAALPRNWRLAKSNAVRTVNPYPVSPATKADTTTQFRGGSLMAANSPAGFYNFGVGDSINAANRAIGFLADANNVKSCNLYFHIKNGASTAITSFDVEIFSRKFKNGSNLAGFQIQMYYSTDGVNWTDAGSDFLMGSSPDGNNNGFTVTTAGLFINTGNLNQTVLPNQQFYFAWSYSVVTGFSTDNAPAYGIDAISIIPNIALPISLVKFEAEKLAEKVKVQWVTATEINNDKFIVERSSNGKDFEYLAEISGAGNSKELNNYELTDASPLKGTSYYRLTQIDFDGASETFVPVAVSGEHGVLSMEVGAGSGENGAGSRENGAGSMEQGVWSIYSPTNAEATLSITDLNGKITFTEKLFLKEGYQNHQFDFLNMEKGIYVVRLVTAKDAVTKKFVSRSF